MRFFWVNIGGSVAEVLKGEFLWAPQYGINKTGNMFKPAGWETVKKVKEGDLIFCHKGRKIIGVATAVRDAYSAPRPEHRVAGPRHIAGTQVDLELTRLELPIDVSLFNQAFIRIHNPTCLPRVFNKTGGCTENYMCEIPAPAAALIASFISENLSINFHADTVEITKEIGGEQATVIQARIGHGPYRDKMFKRWGNRCAVTGIAEPSILIASHIVAWSIATSEEKVDPHNGLPLIPNLDKLFDRGMISFADDGRLLYSRTMSGLLGELRIALDANISGLSEKNRAYLRRHRTRWGFEVEP
ncbi:HNH endonuclease [Serratia marcescens]|uniref:HNH endonuclease n=1 Tax=Serratia TaxID=613 RepID=UPI0018D8EE06|nr:HNH endonuclease [Serratia marcescens]MBH2805832.1 HNH endonuclease [Serratia marcescens]MBH2957670.1 HNH endonuclease [Serratia marcescens]MBN5233281.1 HNH endonuclease [Serratia marcescens]MBN5366907.1 HNH endonuclease [Serratia marcescens]